jgi:hypothetical protein
MSKDFVSGWFENAWLTANTGVTDASLAAHYVVQQDPVTGAFEVGGVEVPPAIPLTFAAMQALDHTQYGTLFFLCTDKHSVGTTGGSLWQNDATGNRVVLLSDPLVFTTLAGAPDPTLYTGLRVLPADVGHVCKSDGVTYRPESWEIVLKNTLTSTPHPGTFSTEAILQSVVFPVDVNNKSIVQNGDIIQVTKAWFEKTGTVNSMTRRYLLGVSTTVGDYTASASGEVLTTTDAAGSTICRADKLFDIMRLSATTATIDGISTSTTATFSTGGPFAVTHNTTTVTTTSFDSATPPSLHFAIKLNGTTDTALALRRGYRVKLIRGY